MQIISATVAKRSGPNIVITGKIGGEPFKGQFSTIESIDGVFIATDTTGTKYRLA